MKILLVDDEPEILEVIAEFLELKGHVVETASNGKSGLDMVLGHNDFDLVFSDIGMPEMDGLTLLEKIRSNAIDTPVILISGQGDVSNTIRALQLGALDFIVKPVYLKSVEEALDKIETAMAAERENKSAVDLISEQRVVMSFTSDLNKIRNVISYFNRYTQDLCGVFDLDANKLAICLQECLTNAIIHGNFKVESRLKEEDWSAFDNLIKERQADPVLGNKKVFITLHQTPQALSFEIQDEGDGFDPAFLPDPTHPESWLKLSGRGILFIRSYMDEVSWNEVGNSITMVKKLS
jgi:YesN/AraC family two-component response regulator